MQKLNKIKTTLLLLAAMCVIGVAFADKVATSIFEGNTSLGDGDGNWGSLELAASNFANVQAGDELQVTVGGLVYGAEESDARTNGQLKSNRTTAGLRLFVGSEMLAEQTDLHIASGDVITFSIDADMAAKMKGQTVTLSGRNVKVTKVTLNTEKKPEIVAKYGVIWSEANGDKYVDGGENDDYIRLYTDYFKIPMKTGDIVRITVYDVKADGEEDAARPLHNMNNGYVVMKDNALAEIAGLEKTELQEDQVIDLVITNEGQLTQLTTGEYVYVFYKHLKVKEIELVENPAVAQAKDDLQQAIDNAKQLDLSNKTDETAQALNDAIANGEQELNNPNATVETLNQAKDAIEAAIDGLKDKEQGQNGYGEIWNSENPEDSNPQDAGNGYKYFTVPTSKFQNIVKKDDIVRIYVDNVKAGSEEEDARPLRGETNGLVEMLDNSEQSIVDFYADGLQAGDTKVDFVVATDAQIAQLTTGDVVYVRYMNLDVKKVELINGSGETEEGITDGVYYLANVGALKFLGSANSWGTQASLVEHPEALTLTKQEDGTYTIDTQVSNGGTSHFFTGSYMDGVALPVNITSTGIKMESEMGDFTAYTITSGEQVFGSDGTTVLANNVTPASQEAMWIIISDQQALAALQTATEEDPIDATFLIKDPNFGRNNRYGKNLSTNTGRFANADWEAGWTFEASNKDNSGDNRNWCVESYHSVFTMSQVIANAPKGVYMLEAQGFYRQDGTDNDNLPVFYANDETATFPMKTGAENSMTDASLSFLNDLYKSQPIYVEVTEDGALTIGAKLETNTGLWCIWDNFELTYFGPDADIDNIKNAALLDELADLRQKAQELKEEVEPEAMKDALQEALDQTADVTGASGSEAIQQAVDILKDAVDKGEGSLIAKNVLPLMKAFLEATNFYTAEAAQTYYGQWQEKYEAGTLTKIEATALQDPNQTTAWRANVTVADLLMSVWEEAPMSWDSYHVNTWSSEGNTDGSNFIVPFIEYWTGDDASLAEKTLTATLNGVDAGKVKVTAWVRVRIKNGAAAPATGITMQVNDGQAVDVADGEQIGTTQFYLKEVTAEGEVGADGVLTLKFVVAADNNISWLAFKNVKYVSDAVANAKDELQKLVDECKQIEQGDYTDESFQALQDEIEDAEEVLADPTATIDDINTAKDELQAAKDALTSGSGDSVMTLTLTTASKAVIYNLNGVRVQNMTKDLYIVNGKKVIVK